jgi:hypothetical protein
MGDTPKAPQKQTKKKAYHPPRLQVYGDLPTISQHVATGVGRPDGSNRNHHLTH